MHRAVSNHHPLYAGDGELRLHSFDADDLEGAMAKLDEWFMESLDEGQLGTVALSQRFRAASDEGRSLERWEPTMTMGTGVSWTMKERAAAV